MAMGDIKSKATLLAYMSSYIYDDLSKYKTMIKKTKEYLGTHFYIKSAKNAKPSNDDPTQIIFNAILDIEQYDTQNTSLEDIYKKYEDKGIFKSYEDCKATLAGLLLAGRIYIN